MKDQFGYEREVKRPGEILTSDYATFSLGGERFGLVASVTVRYQHDVGMFREIGSADAYMTSSNPMGSLTASRGVGTTGMFKSFRPAACGFIEGASVALDGKGNCAEVTTGAGVNIRNVIVRAMGFNVSTGREITEDMDAMFAFVAPT